MIARACSCALTRAAELTGRRITTREYIRPATMRLWISKRQPRPCRKRPMRVPGHCARFALYLACLRGQDRRRKTKTVSRHLPRTRSLMRAFPTNFVMSSPLAEVLSPPWGRRKGREPVTARRPCALSGVNAYQAALALRAARATGLVADVVRVDP